MIDRSHQLSRGALFLIGGLVLLATAGSLWNGFSFDDVPIILENAQVHTLAAPWEYAQQSYWPPRNLGAAYRPWTIWMFAIQWRISGGAPWVFHLVSLFLTAAVTFCVYRLAAYLLPPLAAVAAAALFAVHPVHVEATANLVGQGELWMTFFALAACLIYVGTRVSGAAPSTGQRWAMAGLLILAASAKEQGLVLPGIIVLLELTTARSMTLRARARTVAPTFALLMATAVAFLLGRYIVLGKLGAGPAIAQLDILSTGERLLVMAPMIVEWIRLLVWPQHLEAQYSPPAYGAVPESLIPAAIGFGILLGVSLVAVGVRRTAPVITLGIAWIGCTLIPVANVLFPTGIVIAERTLFLPSVGIVLVAGGAMTWLARRHARALPALAAASALLVILGTARSYSRQGVWRDSLTTFAQTVIDGPRSYRGFQVYGIELARRGQPDDAAAMFSQAAALYGGDVRIFEEWGQIHRARKDCNTAIAIFRRGLEAHPYATTLRSRLFECQMAIGQTSAALETAERGVALGLDEFAGAVVRAQTRLGP